MHTTLLVQLLNISESSNRQIDSAMILKLQSNVGTYIQNSQLTYFTEYFIFLFCNYLVNNLDRRKHIERKKKHDRVSRYFLTCQLFITNLYRYN